LGSQTNGDPTFSRITRWFGIEDKEKLKSFLKRLTSKNYELLCVGHGSVVKRNVSQKIRNAMEKL
jgi:transcriptional regulator of NAD metabolism